MVFVVETGHGDVIERMWRLVVSARRNDDEPEIWRLTEDILVSVEAFYRLGREAVGDALGEGLNVSSAAVTRFLDIPVDPTTTAPHLLCCPNVVYHL
jgi:hypothetical protein